MTDKELMQQALNLLDDINLCSLPPTGIPLPAEIDHVMETLRAQLAQPEPEPVAWKYEFGTDNADAVNDVRWYKNVSLTKPHGMVRNVVPLYTAPPQREWVGLMDEEINYAWRMGEANISESNFEFCYRAIEAALKAKNA